MTLDLDILGRKTIRAIEAHEKARRREVLRAHRAWVNRRAVSIERSRLASLKRQQQEWISRQAQFQQLEIEAELTHWDADRIIRYRSMGYSIHRLAELSGDSTLVVMDVLRSMRRRAK